jgi:cell division protein FtsA
MSMKNDDLIASLDIGTTKIVAMVGRLNEHNKLEILGMGRTESVGVTRGVVTHITPTVEAIKKVIAIAEDQAKCTIGRLM